MHRGSRVDYYSVYSPDTKASANEPEKVVSSIHFVYTLWHPHHPHPHAHQPTPPHPSPANTLCHPHIPLTSHPHTRPLTYSPSFPHIQMMKLAEQQAEVLQKQMSMASSSASGLGDRAQGESKRLQEGGSTFVIFHSLSYSSYHLYMSMYLPTPTPLTLHPPTRMLTPTYSLIPIPTQSSHPHIHHSHTIVDTYLTHHTHSRSRP